MSGSPEGLDSESAEWAQMVDNYARLYGVPIPLMRGGKRPLLGLRWLDEDPTRLAARCKQGDVNVGVRLDRLVDFDLDSREAAVLAGMGLLPRTACFGRVGKPDSHWLYQLDPDTSYRKFEDPTPDRDQNACLLELRTGADKFTRFPGSTHDNGEEVVWSGGDRAPAPLQRPGQIAARLAAACLATRAWVVGRREELATAFAGVLLREGWPEHEVVTWITAVAQAASDEEAQERIKKVSQVANALQQREKKLLGWPSIEERMGRKRTAALRAWLTPPKQDDSLEAVIAEINQKYALINLKGKERVLEILTDPETGYREPAFKTVDDFCKKMANRRIVVDGKLINAGRAWMVSPLRRELDGLAFVPHPPGQAVDLPRHYNFFQGWPVTPREGDCSLYLTHIRETVCRGNDDHFAWFMGVLAHGLQHPADKLGVAIVLRGKQGTGKGKVVEWYARLFGQHYLQITQARQLYGHFNAHLEGKLLVFADEAFWAGDHAAEGVLKALITERESVIERKGIDAGRVTSHLRLIVASNQDWVVPAGPEERRFAVFDVAATHMQDHVYFSAIDQQMRTGGLEALMHHLLSINLGALQLRKIPKTAALLDQKESSADGVTRWFKQCLWQGALSPVADKWDEERAFPVGDLHQEYVQFGKEVGDRRFMSMNVFSKRLRELVPALQATRPTDKQSGERKRAYVFPALALCRAHYDQVMGIETPWPEGSAALRTGEF